ncbi:MAG: PrgI family mobile element protein, partial [Faecousia sp.]
MTFIEVKIPKEIRHYKESIFFGLSARQFFCTI